MQSSAQSNLLRREQADHLGKLPNVVGQTSRHRRSDAQCAVDAAKIVVDEIESHGQPMVLYFFGEPICQPSEAAHLHSHGEVLPLGMARANLIANRRAENNLALRASPTALRRFW